MANKKEKKIYIEYEILDSINEFAKLNHFTFSGAITELCRRGLIIEQCNKTEYEMNKTLNDCKWNIGYIKSLLKQIYSDLNLPFNEIKNSKNLKRFEDSYRNKRIDD